MNEIEDVFGNLKAVDIGRGLASSIVSKLLVELGVRVVRFAPAAGDPFDAVYPAHRAWQDGKEIRTDALDSPTFADAVRSADICIIGGEDFPELARGPDADALLAINPQLVIGELRGAPAYMGRDRPAVDILAQARAGTMFEELADRPVFSALPYPSYGAAVQLLTALFAALYARDATGDGQVASSSLLEGAFTYAVPLWGSAERDSEAFGFGPPRSSRQMIFRCLDGRYIHLVFGVPGGKIKLYNVFGLDTAGVDPADRGVGGSDPQKFYGDVDLFAPLFARRTSDDLLAALTAAGLPNVEILPPGGCWKDPQVDAIGMLRRTADGTRLSGMPFTMDLSGPDHRDHIPTAAGELPLQGIRVLDLGAWVAGPSASLPLADLGAEVIKVEPIEGDPHRFVHASFFGSNRGKKSIALDLKSKEGMAILHKLIAVSHVLHHNFRPGVSTRLGIDPASLQSINAGLVIVESSAYGQRGPRASQPGFDQLFQAFGGHEMRAAAPGEPPFWSRLIPVDYTTAIIGSLASAAALFVNRRLGRGVIIEASLLHTALFLLSEFAQTSNGDFLPNPKINREQTGFHAAERLYRTKDGWIAVAARSQEMAQRLLGALSLTDQIVLGRDLWDTGTADLIARVCGDILTADLLVMLTDADVWAEQCNENGSAWLSDPQMIAHRTINCSAHPRFGEVRQIAALASIRDHLPAQLSGCPILGQDTDAIMEMLEYEPENILEFRNRKVVA